MSKEETEEQIGNKEEYRLILTEWELDIIQQAIAIVTFPGTHVHLATKLLNKLKDCLNSKKKKE